MIKREYTKPQMAVVPVLHQTFVCTGTETMGPGEDDAPPGVREYEWCEDEW